MNYDDALSLIRQKHENNLICLSWDLDNKFIFQILPSDFFNTVEPMMFACINKSNGEITYINLYHAVKLVNNKKPKRVDITEKQFNILTGRA